MDLQLQDKTALISASTTGIGFAIAQGLAAEGVEVTINGRHTTSVEQAVEKLQSIDKRYKVRGISADLGDAAGVNQVTSQIPKLDILINNLGIYECKEFQAISDDDWQHYFEVNVMSGVRLARHYMPAMFEQNWGRVIFISSESAVNIPADMIHYAMTKTAQLAISRGLAETTKGTHVTVNAILPGPTLSEGVSDLMANLAQKNNCSIEDIAKQFIQNSRPSSLIHRLATVEEIANLVTYISSPRASATNGAALRVDGGVVRSVV